MHLRLAAIFASIVALLSLGVAPANAVTPTTHLCDVVGQRRLGHGQQQLVMARRAGQRVGQRRHSGAGLHQ